MAEHMMYFDGDLREYGGKRIKSQNDRSNWLNSEYWIGCLLNKLLKIKFNLNWKKKFNKFSIGKQFKIVWRQDKESKFSQSWIMYKVNNAKKYEIKKSRIEQANH